jgi:ATP-binding cassette subfamily F protein uup
VGLAYGERKLWNGLTMHVVGGERIGVLGPNGSGKTSLLRLVTGDQAPTKGTVTRGLQTKIAYFDQERTQLENEWSIYDNVAERQGAEIAGGGMVQLGERAVELRTYLEMFLFDGHAQRQKVGSLSGGERARVALAKLLKHGANLLLLDEPTNDLDVRSLGALEEMLVGWAGSAIFVSHDRYFVNRVATAVIALESVTHRATVYAGNYDTYKAVLDAANEEAKASPAVGAPPAKPAAPAPASPAASAPKKLTYAERQELDKLYPRIEEGEEAVARLEALLADPKFYAERANEVRAATERLDAARASLAQLYARWEELEKRKGG